MLRHGNPKPPRYIRTVRGARRSQATQQRPALRRYIGGYFGLVAGAMVPFDRRSMRSTRTGSCCTAITTRASGAGGAATR